MLECFDSFIIKIWAWRSLQFAAEKNGRMDVEKDLVTTTCA